MTSIPTLQSDYKHCEQIIKKHSRSFYYAFSRLPKQKAQAVYAIYAFCRTADDSVDENGTREGQLSSLSKMEADLLRFEHGRERNEPLWRALRDVFDRFDMDIQPFYDQLRGQAMDIDFKIPETLEDLESYSYFVAGTVGLMLLPIIASKRHEYLKKDAVNLGIAMQLTNILRDVGEDYTDKNRIYLPKAEMKNALYTNNDIENGIINDSFIDLWERLASIAEERYEKFHETVFHYDADSRLPVIISAKVYEGILNEVRRNGYDCFTKKQAVSKLRMKAILQNIKLKESI